MSVTTSVLIYICYTSLMSPSRTPVADLREFISQQDRLGRVTRDVDRPGSPIVGLDLSLTHVTDDQIAMLIPLDTLQTLQLFRTPIGDRALTSIGKMTSLRRLDLGLTEITNQGLANLRNLTNLEEIELTHDSLEDPAFVHLKELKKLKELNIFDNRITNKGLQHLMGLGNLRVLNIGNQANITDQGPQMRV